jgi:hypothetical protein
MPSSNKKIRRIECSPDTMWSQHPWGSPHSTVANRRRKEIFCLKYVTSNLFLNHEELHFKLSYVLTLTVRKVIDHEGWSPAFQGLSYGAWIDCPIWNHWTSIGARRTNCKPLESFFENVKKGHSVSQFTTQKCLWAGASMHLCSWQLN